MTQLEESESMSEDDISNEIRALDPQKIVYGYSIKKAHFRMHFFEFLN